MRDGVAILVAEHCVLAQMRVGSNEGSYLLGSRRERVDWDVMAVNILVKHVGVSVRKGASFDVLA